MLTFKGGRSKKRIATLASGGIRITQNWNSRSMLFTLMIKNNFKKIRGSMSAEKIVIIQSVAIILCKRSSKNSAQAFTKVSSILFQVTYFWKEFPLDCQMFQTYLHPTYYTSINRLWKVLVSCLRKSDFLESHKIILVLILKGLLKCG